MSTSEPASRIAGIDFVRGVAVLGILTINVIGFWGPTLASFNPNLPRTDPGGALWFSAAYVLFEGKLRGLFTLLFGASMVLFADAAERRGAQPDWAQARRLGWLALFGYAHYLLMWWGDILFPYAVCGLMALVLAVALRRLDPVPLAAAALVLFCVSHGLDSIGDIAGIAEEQRVLAGHGSPAEMAEQSAMMGRIAASISADLRILHAGFFDALHLRLTTAPFLPLETTGATFAETFPLMLLGNAAMRSGLFTGGWSEPTLRRVAALGIGTGGTLSLALIGWSWAHQFPPRAMFAMMGSLAALPHLLMTFGYLAALLLLWPKLAGSATGQRLAAAGRCAFTNYIGTTVLMTALFSGWGLGLAEAMPRGLVPLFIPVGWAAMLIWPQAWLTRFGIGPLEGLWRRLTWWGWRA